MTLLSPIGTEILVFILCFFSKMCVRVRGVSMRQVLIFRLQFKAISIRTIGCRCAYQLIEDRRSSKAVNSPDRGKLFQLKSIRLAEIDFNGFELKKGFEQKKAQGTFLLKNPPQYQHNKIQCFKNSKSKKKQTNKKEHVCYCLLFEIKVNQTFICCIFF